ncbi:DUF6928 family protein [Nocardia cyriacigeorgica]|uniref:DUF6928 family protein n=1 Tax=Nocardia cyriacigeorgica TaxID=135487 RepID=UPI00245440BF|nr:hypothetical protein [Nocardia cyriacigeorgica]
MLSKASSLWYVDAPDPHAVLRENHDSDPDAARALAEQLHPDRDVVPIMVGTLGGCAGPDADEVYIGCYPGVTVVCSPQVARVRPTALPTPLIRPLASEHTYLIAFDTGHRWGSFAHWERGEFRRAFSANRVHILEDEGLPLVWERPYWAGEHPVRLQVGDMPTRRSCRSTRPISPTPPITNGSDFITAHRPPRARCCPATSRCAGSRCTRRVRRPIRRHTPVTACRISRTGSRGAGCCRGCAAAIRWGESASVRRALQPPA